jgi:hypothetical protein
MSIERPLQYVLFSWGSGGKVACALTALLPNSSADMSADSIRTVASSLYDANTGEEIAVIPQTYPRSTITNLRPQDNDAESHREHIGPIARLNPDELMFIFELSAEVNWTAPLSISRVCRGWRSIILATPRVWANLHLPERPPVTIISLYVTRSQPLLLRLVTPRSTSHPLPYITVINNISHRVGFLNILQKQLPLLTGQFPALRRLHLSRSEPGGPGEMYVDVDFSMFPELCALCLDGVTAPPARLCPAPTCPKIQQLALWTDHGRDWHSLIKFFAKDLVSLRLRVLYVSALTTVEPLYLPVLRHLHLFNAGYDAWEFAAKTPSLTSYLPLRAFAPRRMTFDPKLPFSVSVDVAGVTHLKLLEDIDLSLYANLRYLQICFPPENIIQRLEHRPSLCQDLETIESLIDYGDLPTATEIDREILGVTKQLHIIKTRAWNREFPFHMAR